VKERILQFVQSSSAARLFAALVAVFLSVFAVWWGALNQDEGWYLYAAQLVREGRFPYHDFFFTQGPALPFVYSALAPIWQSPSSPLGGLLGGRIVTLAFGFAAVALSVALVRRLVAPEKRSAAGLAVFAVLACNLYHIYFNAIPKTYALGSTFLMGGFLLVAWGLEKGGWRRAAALSMGGMSLAFASGTRISLVLVLPVVGMTLLLRFREWRWSFVWFGVGGALGLMLTYGFFALDPASLKGLLAAQAYHAARGGFDPFFAAGSVSRLARGYAALGVMLIAALALRGARRDEAADGLPGAARTMLWALGLSFAAVFLLQISAPFPYDDYQVPIMSPLSVVVVAFFYRRGASHWLPVLAAALISFSSPLLQQWTTFTQDRFWSRKKPCTELAKLREMAHEINVLDPGGKELLTQDLYLAVETGRRVPSGFEMGPFSYFPEMSSAEARSLHVFSTEDLEALLENAPCRMAAFSGYSFAIAAPTCREVPYERQKAFWLILRKNYERVDAEPDFGQNATTLLVLKRKEQK
jgi:hypothetical protein